MARKFVGLSLAAFAAIFCATPVLAQSAVWVIDSAHSTARLFAASSNRNDLINVAVARMSGEVKQNSGAALPGSFNFEIYPADQYPRATQSGGRGSAAKSSPPWWEATLIRFQSTSVEPVDENTVRVRGQMTASYVSRETTWAGPSFRDYYGPKYGPPHTHTATEQVTFEFRKARRNEAAVTAEWAASTTVRSTDFPTLWNAVVATTWPVFEVRGTIVEKAPRTDLHCVMPAMLTEGFYGEVCNGSALQILSEPDSDSAPAANQTGASAGSLANEVLIKLDVYLVKIS